MFCKRSNKGYGCGVTYKKLQVCLSISAHEKWPPKHEAQTRHGIGTCCRQARNRKYRLMRQVTGLNKELVRPNRPYSGILAIKKHFPTLIGEAYTLWQHYTLTFKRQSPRLQKDGNVAHNKLYQTNISGIPENTHPEDRRSSTLATHLHPLTRNQGTAISLC